MQCDYLFLSKENLEFPLDESIAVSNNADTSTTNEYIVANTDVPNTQIYAPEINFYIRNTKDDISTKIQNIKHLYEIRSLAFDLAQDLDYKKEVNNKLLIVTDNEEKYEQILQNDKFVSITLSPDMIIDVNGHIGELNVSIKKDDNEYEIQCDQIIWENAPEFAMKQSGTYDLVGSSLQEVFKQVQENLNGFKYKNFIVYDSKICQYNERTTEICGKCAEVCPTISIVKEDATKHLLFSEVDCLGCGGCISVCPSGALDYTQMPRDSFYEIEHSFVDKIALVLPRKMSLEELNVDLPAGVLPFAIEGEKYLHEAHMLSLIQTSGNPIIFYTDFVSKGTGDAIRVVNEIFQLKYKKRAIFVCKNKSELENAFEQVQSISECKYGINELDLRKREIFSARLAHLVGKDDLGVVKTGEHIHYGNITINTDNCTLCLSCVGACNVRALTAHPEDNSLRFNPSICTNCTYCEVVCPEKDCLSVQRDEISLKPSYFIQNIMARDELFKCVECGVEFAPKKAIEKIANIMIPRFGGDETKIKTLYCCADCKPKVILQAQINEQMKQRGK